MNRTKEAKLKVFGQAESQKKIYEEQWLEQVTKVYDLAT